METFLISTLYGMRECIGVETAGVAHSIRPLCPRTFKLHIKEINLNDYISETISLIFLFCWQSKQK